MISITEGTREKPSQMVCECGEIVNIAIHHDYIEGGCTCGKQYCIPMVNAKLQVFKGIWNCCSKPLNK